MKEMIITITRWASSSSFTSSSFFLFPPFRLWTQKGNNGLSRSAEGPPTQTLQHSDRSSASTEHSAHPTWLALALIGSPRPGVQLPVQPMEPQKIPLRVLRGVQKKWPPLAANLFSELNRDRTRWLLLWTSTNRQAWW